MISVSQNYINNLSSRAFSPKSKIIVDGVTYLGNVIKTFPKIKHQASTVAGCFPAKTLDFEIYDYNNNLDFQDKEIEVYKGFLINGVVEYVKQGIFIPQAENITRDISSKVIKFNNVQDRTQLLESKYETQLDYSNNVTHTGLEIVQEICTRHSITLLNNNFAFASYNFPQPNFNEDITDREVISRLAEIGGEIAFFNYNGSLVIKSQTNTNTTIPRGRYEKISEEKSVTFNTVVLGKEGMDDDIVYPETIAVDRVEYKILDNPFVDLIRTEIIQTVAGHIIGLTYMPYKLTGFIDGFIYELNDVVSVSDRNGNTVRAVILDYESTSRYKSNVKVDLEVDTQKTNYNLAGSSKKAEQQIKLSVDHFNKQIDAIVSDINEQGEEIASAKATMNSQGLKLDILSTNIDEDGNVTSLKSKKGYTFDDNGLNISESDTTLNTQINNVGTYYKDGDTILGQTTKDGSKFKDMDLFGVYRYGKNSINDEPMFIAQLYTDGNNEECFGHFWYGG